MPSRPISRGEEASRPESPATSRVEVEVCVRGGGDGSVAALRYDAWKVTFLEQEEEGLKVWQNPFTPLRAPKICNLRMDPFERAEQEHAMGYQRRYMDRMFIIAPAGAYVGKWLQSFKEFPPRQKPGSFNLDRVMEAVMAGSKQ